MADGTKIEWSDATWNIVTGCSVVSPGCTNCYAMKLAGTRLRNHHSRAGLTRATKAGPVWTGEVRFNEDWLDQPLRWKRPRRIFVCAHGDLFHEKVPDAWLDKIFAVMALCPRHTFQVLTKRPERMRAYLSTAPENAVDARICALDPKRWAEELSSGPRFPLPNVWLGTSVEDQQRAEERIPDLLWTPAAKRWLSCEPLLRPLDLEMIDLAYVESRELEPSGLVWLNALDGVHMDKEDAVFGLIDDPDPHIDWVVVGGESGPGARPMHPDWARSLRDQCAAAGVPFLFKQWGEWLPCEVDVPGDGTVVCYPDDGSERDMEEIKGSRAIDRSLGREMWRVGKKHAGRLLDGVEHNGYPA